MQALGLHPSANNHSCPKLRWVSGMNHMVPWESENCTFSPRFPSACTVLGIPFPGSFLRKGNTCVLMGNYKMKTGTIGSRRHADRKQIQLDIHLEQIGRSRNSALRISNYIDFGNSVPHCRGWSFGQKDFSRDNREV